MLTTPLSVEILLFASAAIVFLWQFVSEKQWQLLSARQLTPSLKSGAIVLTPFMLLFGAAALAQFKAGAGALFFLGGFVVPYILAKIGMTRGSRSLLLLIGSALICKAIGQDEIDQLVSIIAGMLTWRFAANLESPETAELDDILPGVLWLSTVLWSQKGGGGIAAENQQGLIFATLAVSIFLTWVQKPLLKKEDPVYLKRIVLSIVGGLLTLVVIMKLLVTSHLDKVSLLVGFSFLGSYFLQSMENDKGEKLSCISAIKQVLLIGIFTVVATRTFGTIGTLVVASTTLVAVSSQVAQTAALFWIGRALAQVFIVQFNPNVTGVNLNHAYTSAALYAGFLLAIVIVVLLRDLTDRKLLTTAFLACAVLLPASANFFIHAEPTSSLLVASTVSCLMAALFAASLLKQELPGAQSIIVLPALMAVVAYLSSELLNLGDQASSQNKLVALGVIAFVLFCIALIRRIFTSPRAAQPAPAGGGDQAPGS